MAKTVVANLNGGDAITADNDLTYRIYGNVDSYTSPIDTFGSHTNDADVTVAAGVVTITNVAEGANTSLKITSIDEAANESPQSDAFAIVTGYKLVTSGATDNDRLQWDAVEKIDLLHTENWVFETKIKPLLLTTEIRTLVFGAVNNTLQIRENGDIEYKDNGVKISDWTAAHTETGGSGRTISDFNDGLQHIYKLSWTLGDGGCKLQIDDAIFGEAPATNTPPLVTFSPSNLGYSAVKLPNEIEWLKITKGATLYEYKFNEGSGLIADYEGGTDHTIILGTDNTTGQEARMWQTV